MTYTQMHMLEEAMNIIARISMSMDTATSREYKRLDTIFWKMDELADIAREAGLTEELGAWNVPVRR